MPRCCPTPAVRPASNHRSAGTMGQVGKRPTLDASQRSGRSLFGMAQLEIRNLHVGLEDGTEIVKGVDLEVDLGQKHAIMGPNGSGKSTLAYALMGHPAYEVTEGQILFDGEDLTELGADERAQRRLFL